MEYFVTSDTHFGHGPNLKGYGGIIFHANRPFSSIHDHDEFLISQWNKTVGKKDTTYILGDFAWKNHNHYIMALNGKKILITGSHDKMGIETKRLFTEYHNGMLIRAINKVRFIMTHCAMLVWEGSHYGSINLHGHSHLRLIEHNNIKRMDVGVDGNPNFAPWNIDFIIYKMSLKEPRETYRSDEELDAEVLKNKQNNTELFNKWITRDSK